MTPATVHLINHTHWDREWFLTSIYTSRWIAGLIDRLEVLVEKNPAFQFLLDGQTLVIEDLLKIAPEHREKIDRLVRNENLLIGPYYCQPDWRLTGGEALLRNLLLGQQDMQQHNGGSQAGWLVDTFGHISQAPQLHRLFGINSVYIWRGAPRMEPYFQWQGADGSRLFTINLFGGYRNLYGVTHVPEIATKRLEAEVVKLQPYYPTADIPLFDGYDLEDNPEDPVRFYQNPPIESPLHIDIQPATPANFAKKMRRKLLDLPVVSGELNSGKYGAIFPGTLSTRTYLKLMAHDCDVLLYQVCEPLGVLARLRGRPYPTGQYEIWSRILLQNAVHDCICGVSIDQVHEKMEFSYQQVFEAMQADIQRSLEYILADFAPGRYAVSTNPFHYTGWHAASGSWFPVLTQGIGIWEIGEQLPSQEMGRSLETFEWKNDYYIVLAQAGGVVQVGGATLGRLLVFEELGDTYSDERGRFLGELRPAGPLLVEVQSEHYCVLRGDCSATWDQIRVSAVLRLTFDQSPLIRWQVELDSSGTDFQVEMVFETAQSGQVYAGMPFDVVRRAPLDRDLLPRQLDKKLESVLLGQRELGAVQTFPFQDFVAISDGTLSAAVLAKGLHAYQAGEGGHITITLRRSVEWLTKPDLQSRIGDAGPFFYVPDARCERKVTHELAFMIVDFGVDDQRFMALNAGFQNPPLLVDIWTTGTRRQWSFFQESIPLSSLLITGDRVLARFYNPGANAVPLSKPYLQADISANLQESVIEVPPKTILTVDMDEPLGPERDIPGSRVDLLNAPDWRVGVNQGLPDPAVIAQLKGKITALERKIEAVAAKLNQSPAQERYHLQHQVYVLQRELLEYQLSVRLNEIKLAMGGELTSEYLFTPDEEIASIGRQLNRLRIQRRIYDYIVQAV